MVVLGRSRNWGSAGHCIQGHGRQTDV